MSSSSPNSSPEPELHQAVYADHADFPPTPPPTPVISTQRRHCSGSSIDGRPSSPCTHPGSLTPKLYDLIYEALVWIRAYEPEQARGVLDEIDDEVKKSALSAQVREELQIAVEEAKDVAGAMASTQTGIARAQRVGNWEIVLTVMLSFERTMFRRSNGSPRHGYRFPLPKRWLFTACESLAYLGLGVAAERLLTIRLMVDGGLTPVEQTWLMGLIAYVSGNVRACISYLQSIPTQAGTDWSRSLLERAEVVQNALDVLESLDFSTKDASQQFRCLASQLGADDSYELLDQCIRKYVKRLFHQKKKDAASSCLPTPENSQQESQEPPASARIRLDKVTNACSLFHSLPSTKPAQRATSVLAVGGLQHGTRTSPAASVVGRSSREMGTSD